AAQALVTLMLLTLVFARRQALGGLPTPVGRRTPAPAPRLADAHPRPRPGRMARERLRLFVGGWEPGPTTLRASTAEHSEEARTTEVVRASPTATRSETGPGQFKITC
ncbi:hypothetical protein ACWES4_30160, partial [Streptomyces sp. NPDC004011]